MDSPNSITVKSKDLQVVCYYFYINRLRLALQCLLFACRIKAAFHDTCTDTGTNILARILERMSVSVSVSWNAAFNVVDRLLYRWRQDWKLPPTVADLVHTLTTHSRREATSRASRVMSAV